MCLFTKFLLKYINYPYIYKNYGVSNSAILWVTGRKSFNNKYEWAIPKPIRS